MWVTEYNWICMTCVAPGTYMVVGWSNGFLRNGAWFFSFSLIIVLDSDLFVLAWGYVFDGDYKEHLVLCAKACDKCCKCECFWIQHENDLRIMNSTAEKTDWQSSRWKGQTIKHSSFGFGDTSGFPCPCPWLKKNQSVVKTLFGPSIFWIKSSTSNFIFLLLLSLILFFVYFGLMGSKNQ